MKGKTFGMAAAIAAALAIGALPAAAQVGDGRLGGPPEGVADDTICAGGEAVTGVTGFTRTIGGNIRIVAVATVQCAGGGPASTMGSMTSSVDELPGGTSCLPGQVAVGIQGREGDFVDNLFLRCALPDGSGPITPSAPVFGAFGGHEDGPYDCPAGQVLTGLTGQSVFTGTTIRWVEIVCVPAPPVCPPNGDGDDDGLTDENESLFFTLLDDDDSDDDGIRDGNDDANGNGEDDEDEDDDEDDDCPDEDSDDDGEDDEDEDDDDEDDDDD
jgi:hypothetical protein